MRRVFFLFLMFAAMPAGEASTPSAWAALDRSARAGCNRAILKSASNAQRVQFSGKISGIGGKGDDDRYYALLATGQLAGSATQWLCLYDKREKVTIVREIEHP